MNEVLTRIQTLMDERNWTLYKLAQEANIPYSSLSSLFQKNNQPTISTLEKICQGLHISIAEFFSDRPPYREPTDTYSEEEKALIRDYRKLSRKNKTFLSDFTKLLLSQE